MRMDFPTKQYRTILIDPPWKQPLVGRFYRRSKTATVLPYETMSMQEILELPIQNISEPGTHIWLWTTNRLLHDAFHVIEAWGFKYLNTITWVKPSGVGAWFANTTQHLIFAYNKKCIFQKARYRPTHLFTSIPKRHSEKPSQFYDLIESISIEPRIELFARNRRDGWDAWGDQVPNHCQKLMTKEDARPKEDL
jgi:N6-adenosine-specific RNA methylase IME4